MQDPIYLGIIDAETTGLDIHDDYIIEIAFILTDLDFNVLSEYHTVVKLPYQAAWYRFEQNPITWDMHTKSGLVKILQGRGGTHAGTTIAPTLEAAEADIMHWLRRLGVNKREVGFAGSGVARFDMNLFEEQLPKLFEFFHYRPYDITVYRNLTKFFLGNYGIDPVEASFKDGKKAHRAIADAWAHLEEFKAYRKWIRTLVGINPSSMTEYEITGDEGVITKL